MHWRGVRHRAEYFFFRCLTCVLAVLSVRQTAALSRGLATLLCWLPRKWTRHEVARENLQRAFPQGIEGRTYDQVIFEMWVHLFRLVAEVVQSPRKLTLTNCREVVVFRNRQRVVAAFGTGRPVFVLGGHFGNWEVTMATFGLFGMPMGVVARELDNPYLHRWFEESRRSVGHRLLLKKGGWDEMLELLQARGCLGLLADQDAGRKGTFVDFFGHPASTHKSIALMAIEHDALLAVGYGRRLPDDFENARWSQFEIGCEELLDSRDFSSPDELTRGYTAALERAIRHAPEQYFWLHRRWKTAAPAQRAIANLKKAG